jgi:hypothetical protein
VVDSNNQNTGSGWFWSNWENIVSAKVKVKTNLTNEATDAMVFEESITTKKRH